MPNLLMVQEERNWSRRVGTADCLFPLSASSAVNGRIFIKDLTPHPSPSILASHAFMHTHTYTQFLVSLASSYTNSRVWECLKFVHVDKCERKKE